jgi:hypothetical protein
MSFKSSARSFFQKYEDVNTVKYLVSCYKTTDSDEIEYYREELDILYRLKLIKIFQESRANGETLKNEWFMAETGLRRAYYAFFACFNCEQSLYSYLEEVDYEAFKADAIAEFKANYNAASAAAYVAFCAAEEAERADAERAADDHDAKVAADIADAADAERAAAACADDEAYARRLANGEDL